LADLLRDPALAGKTTLSLDLEVIPFTFSHILLPGTYRLKIIIGSTEVEPIMKYLEIRMIGTWHDNEAVFLGPCVSITLVNSNAT
ncbi:MAG: hypothetical protein IMZ50_12915, partial [Candidatus Atribacteria bacterium]|nr:hypothetical protein [Candidatus Atribacteria bacterium]